MPLFREGTRTVVGVVLVTAPLKDVDAAVRAVQRQLLQAALLALGLSLLLGYMASYFIAGRLKRIERSAEAIAGGDLSTNVPASLQDEIGQLAQTFNTMAERLRDAFAQVEHERDRVEVLLNDLSEGVVGISSDGRVTIANPAAAELLGRPIAVDASVDTALPEDIAAMWHESRRDEAELEVVFENDDKTLEGTTYAVGGDADFTSIVVLRDVSAQARLERARRDFIANASHEFKTPLFSLGGSLELLDEGDLSPEEQREFLQVMRVQVERLRNLAVSMLDLSRVEAGSVPIDFEMVPLEDVALSVVDEFQVQTQDRSLTMRVSGDDVSAWCDEQRLAQVLRALLDNAVKYTPRGGAVSILVGGDEQWARIVVSDDGPGIAEAELPHVFERFHRGREERATTSGAGLGLSIAREITELMGGSITAATGTAGGATFTVTLPRRPHRRGSPDGGPAPAAAVHEVHDS